MRKIRNYLFEIVVYNTEATKSFN